MGHLVHHHLPSGREIAGHDHHHHGPGRTARPLRGSGDGFAERSPAGPFRAGGWFVHQCHRVPLSNSHLSDRSSGVSAEAYFG
jgi:hypothetical protein